jgi:hypothetical protein
MGIAGILLFGVLLIVQIVVASPSPAVEAIEQKDREGILGIFVRMEDANLIRPIPSGNPTPLPTFTPTPTPTNTPTPTPTNTPTPTPTPTITPTPTVRVAPAAPDWIEGFITKYAAEYGVDAALIRRIAHCESGYGPGADREGGKYGGMFQYSVETWASDRAAMGLDGNPSLRYNAEESVRTAAFKISRGGQRAWAGCL